MELGPLNQHIHGLLVISREEGSMLAGQAVQMCFRVASYLNLAMLAGSQRVCLANS